MKILKDDHVITGDEFVRHIVPLSSIGSMSSDCALSTMLIKWYPIKMVLGYYWKGKTVKKANWRGIFEFASVEPGEYFPNVGKSMPDSCADASCTWRSKIK